MLYSLAGGGTLCGVAALVLLIVSTATDFWMQYRYSGSSANQGLWRFCINHKCHAHTITVGECSRSCKTPMCLLCQELKLTLFDIFELIFINLGITNGQVFLMKLFLQKHHLRRQFVSTFAYPENKPSICWYLQKPFFMTRSEVLKTQQSLFFC